MAGKSVPNRTTVILTYLEDKASKPVRAVLGLRQVLSAGVRLFLQLSSEEQMKLVGQVMEDEKKYGPLREKERAALFIFEQLSEEAQEKALNAVQKPKKRPKLDVAALKDDIQAIFGSRRRAAKPARQKPL